MIEKMKTVRIVAQTSRKKELLDELRRLGIVHIAEKHSADEISQKAQKGHRELCTAVGVPEKAHLAGIEIEAEIADDQQCDTEQRCPDITVINRQQHRAADGNHYPGENAIRHSSSYIRHILSSPLSISPIRQAFSPASCRV